MRKSCAEPDIMLPVAHTCFFSIELPKYSSNEILRDKLKYAITHCQAIDTDGRAFDVWEDDDWEHNNNKKSLFYFIKIN